MWRNRQTQQTQNLPVETPWGFEPLHPQSFLKEKRIGESRK